MESQRTWYGLALLVAVSLMSVIIFAVVSEQGTTYAVPRFVSHISNKILVISDIVNGSDDDIGTTAGRDRASAHRGTILNHQPDSSMWMASHHTATTGGQRPPYYHNDLNQPAGRRKIFDYGNMTSPRNSRHVIDDPHHVYNVGDRIKVLIETCTDRNQPKTTGGDIMRATLYTTEERAGSSTDGEVVDLDNGWYEAVFTLRWPGVIKMKVVLVHPIEALRIIQYVVSTRPVKMAYIGQFVKGATYEIRRCNIIPPEFGPMCNFTTPSGVQWYCQPPRHRDLSCKDWRWSQSDEPATKTLIKTILQGYDDGFPINRYREPISTGNVDEILVVVPDSQDTGRGMNLAHTEFPWQGKNLPPCRPGQHIGTTAPSGYFYHDTWYSLHCHIRHHWTPPKITECLRNTSVHMIGDSSGRQIYTMLTNMLGNRITRARTRFLHESEERSGPRWARDDVNGIYIRFNFHGFPIGGSNWFNRSNIMDAAMRLDAIRSEPGSGGSDRVVVVMTIGAHFVYHDLDFYEARLRVMKSAIDRLLHRIPDALVIIKSMTAREYNNVFHITASGEWWMWRMDQSMRRIIASDPRIALIDAWDMTKAMLFPYNVHPHGTVIANFISHMLSYVCPMDNIN